MTDRYERAIATHRWKPLEDAIDDYTLIRIDTGFHTDILEWCVDNAEDWWWEYAWVDWLRISDTVGECVPLSVYFKRESDAVTFALRFR